MALPEQVALRQQAERLAVSQRWDEEARRINARLIEIDPCDVAAHTRLARCYRLNGDARTAAALYRRVLSLQPNNRIAANALAVIADEIRIQDANAGASTYQKTFALGVAARRRGDSAAAVALLTRALELRPTHAAKVALAAARRDRQELDVAEELCKQVLAEEPSYIPAKIVLAATYCDRGVLSAARALIEDVLQREPTNMHAMRVLSRVYAGLGNNTEARAWYTRSEGTGQRSSDR